MASIIGGSSADEELKKLSDIAHLAQPITTDEFKQRLKRAAGLMKDNGLDAMYLNAGTNLYYFTGTKWNSSERMVGAWVLADGSLHYIAPAFEKGTILDFLEVDGEIHCWEEHESPYQLFISILEEKGIFNGKIGIDESTPFFVFNGVKQLTTNYEFVDAKSVTAGCRMYKSDSEINIIQTAMNMTLEVQKAAARILRIGITSQEVTEFIHEAHKIVGASSGSYFCIVLFGKDTSFPHGVKNPKPLEENDTVLVDTGCMLHGYISDITRTYVFGTPNQNQKDIWNIEKDAQIAAFNSIKKNSSVGSIDSATRLLLEKRGLGPDYQLPGLPHRTGHGIGLDIHEWPYLVESDKTPVDGGMCFSIEPMICVPNQFGIRLEDHVYMSKNGPKWFTQPANSIENPF